MVKTTQSQTVILNWLWEAIFLEFKMIVPLEYPRYLLKLVSSVLQLYFAPWHRWCQSGSGQTQMRSSRSSPYIRGSTECVRFHSDWKPLVYRWSADPSASLLFYLLLYSAIFYGFFNLGCKSPAEKKRSILCCSCCQFVMQIGNTPVSRVLMLLSLDFVSAIFKIMFNGRRNGFGSPHTWSLTKRRVANSTWNLEQKASRAHICNRTASANSSAADLDSDERKKITLGKIMF